MRFFDELGARIEQRWKEHQFDDSVFPEIATAALESAGAITSLSPWDIVRWLNTTESIPVQQDLAGSFGNPPITLFQGERFHIDIYFWLDGTTTIHQHGFCGALQVLLGSSIHCEYNFKTTQELSTYFRVGEVKLIGVDLLEQGTIRRIDPGTGYIHSLFHLQRPSATICVRTHTTATGTPQYNYHPPSFAIVPTEKTPLATRRYQAADLLLAMKHPEAGVMIHELLGHADFPTTFFVLDLVRSHLKAPQLRDAFGLGSKYQFADFLETARRFHGNLVDLITPVLNEERRKMNIVHLRSSVTSPEHRSSWPCC